MVLWSFLVGKSTVPKKVWDRSIIEGISRWGGAVTVARSTVSDFRSNGLSSSGFCEVNLLKVSEYLHQRPGENWKHNSSPKGPRHQNHYKNIP